MRRVVVTGLGLVTPLGVGVANSWSELLQSRSGIRQLSRLDVGDLPAKIGGSVPRGTGPAELNVDSVLPAKQRRRLGDFMLYALVAAREALADSGYAPASDAARERSGVMIGSGIGGLPEIERASVALHERGPRKVSPYFIPSALVNEASGIVAIEHGFRGPNHAVATACSTGAHALGDAMRLIQYDDADVMLAGGTEAALSRLTIAGFSIMQALSTRFNDTPQEACRPWDRARDGFVLAEGAGVVVLEELEHARRRGARIYAELLGYGLSGDAYHITSPAPDGAGAARAMRAALKRAGISAQDIDYINAHATSTPIGDPAEIKAVKSVCGGHAHALSISSTKSATGHLLGAAGAVEAIFSVLALRDQVVPPTLNLTEPSDGCDLDFVAGVAKQRRVRRVLSNSFAFGGANVALVLGRWEAGS